MSTATSLDRIGVGIDTARYGHRVSFLRPDRKPAAKPLTVMENRAGYQALQERLKQCRHVPPALVVEKRTLEARPPACGTGAERGELSCCNLSLYVGYSVVAEE